MAILMTAKEFIDKCKEVQKSNTVYMWGTYGQILTNALIDYKAGQYPTPPTEPLPPQRSLRWVLGNGYNTWSGRVTT